LQGISKETASLTTAMRTKQSKMRLFSIDITDRLSPKGRSYGAFVIELVGWRRIQFAALAHPKWRQSPVTKLETFFDPNKLET
jgi:hypothetical protein